MDNGGFVRCQADGWELSLRPRRLGYVVLGLLMTETCVPAWTLLPCASRVLFFHFLTLQYVCASLQIRSLGLF